MALSFNTKVGQSYRMDSMEHGLLFKHVEMTFSANGDYGTVAGNLGFQLQANAAKIGFRKIYFVLAVSVRDTTTGSPFFPTRRVIALWAPTEGPTQANQGNLRLLQGAEAEVTAGTNILTTDVISMVVVGV